MPKSTKISLPKLPKMPSARRNPPGWNLTEIHIQNKGLRGAEKFKRPEPAGDPPSWWVSRHPTGSRPEWAVYWGLMKQGLQVDLDFFYVPKFRTSVGTSGFSQIDFSVPNYGIAIEVQGTFWHYGQGTKKVGRDLLRATIFAG
ncbi:hypothetical protein, partial [Nitrolancea hollandica]|uniref:hypothetical protein n=1 Tax=Nitrolancea hollandica TaxID=1206749 RepID=UPI00058F539D